MLQKLSKTINVPSRAFISLTQFITFASILLAAVSESRPADRANTVANAANEIRPLTLGQSAPALLVRAVDGSEVTIDARQTERPMLVITFRGGWCPYCNFHLAELRNVIPELEDAGVDVIFLSGDRPELLFDSLSLETRESIAELDYSIYSDAEGHAATALGIAFRAAESTIQRRREKGQDIDGSSMDRRRILAVPSVFVIDARGIIRFVYANPNYKIRLPAKDIRDAALATTAG